MEGEHATLKRHVNAKTSFIQLLNASYDILHTRSEQRAVQQAIESAPRVGIVAPQLVKAESLLTPHAFELLLDQVTRVDDHEAVPMSDSKAAWTVTRKAPSAKRSKKVRDRATMPRRNDPHRFQNAEYSDGEDDECPDVPAEHEPPHTVRLLRDVKTSFCYYDCSCGFWNRNCMICRHTLVVAGGLSSLDVCRHVHFRWFKATLTTGPIRFFGDGHSGPLATADTQLDEGDGGAADSYEDIDYDFDVTVRSLCASASSEADRDAASADLGTVDGEVKKRAVTLRGTILPLVEDIINDIAVLPDRAARRIATLRIYKLLKSVQDELRQVNGDDGGFSVRHNMLFGPRAKHFHRNGKPAAKTSARGRLKRSATDMLGDSSTRVASKAVVTGKRAGKQSGKRAGPGMASLAKNAPSGTATATGTVRRAAPLAKTPDKSLQKLTALDAAPDADPRDMRRILAPLRSGAEVARNKAIVKANLLREFTTLLAAVESQGPDFQIAAEQQDIIAWRSSANSGKPIDASVIRDFQKLASARVFRHLFHDQYFFETPLWGSNSVFNSCPIDSTIAGLIRFLCEHPATITQLQAVVDSAVATQTAKLAASAILDAHRLARARAWDACRARLVHYWLFDTTAFENERDGWRLDQSNRISLSSNVSHVHRLLWTALPGTACIQTRITTCCDQCGAAAEPESHDTGSTGVALAPPKPRHTSKSVKQTLQVSICNAVYTSRKLQAKCATCSGAVQRRRAPVSFPELRELYVYSETYGGAFYDVNELPVHLAICPPADQPPAATVNYELYNVWQYNGGHFNGYFCFEQPRSNEPYWVFNDCFQRPTTQEAKRGPSGITPPDGYEVVSVWYRRK